MQYLVKSKRLTLDMICLELYNETANYTEMVLAENPGLAALGEFVPIGTVLNVPEVKQAVVKTQKNLWD